MSGTERAGRGWLLLIALSLPACGADHTLSPDAATATDGSSDADLRGVVTVTALDPAGNGLPLRGSHVFFHDPDGSLVSDVVVLDDATVSASLLPGASVTAFWPVSASDYRMETVLDVEPGDHLVLSFSTGQTAPTSTMHLAFAADPTATSYDIFTPYELPTVYSTTTGADISATAAQAATAGDYFVSARNGNDLIGFLEADHIAFVAGSTQTLGGPWHAFDDCSVSYQNVPSGATLASRRYASSSWGLLTVLDPAGTPGTFAGPCAATAAPAMVTTSVWPSAVSEAHQTINEVIPADQLTHDADVGALLLPWLDAPVFDLATGTVSTHANGSASVDAFMVEVTYQRPIAPTFPRNYDWIVLGPRIEDVRLPTLPSGLALRPAPTDTSPSARATAFEWSAVSDYATFKPSLETSISGPVVAAPSAAITRSSVSALAQ